MTSIANWAAALAQRYPERVTLVALIPGLIFVGAEMVKGIMASPWMAIILVPLFCANAAVIWMIARIAKLLRHLDETPRSDS